MRGLRQMGMMLALALAGAVLAGGTAQAAPPCHGGGPCEGGTRREERQREIAALHARVLKERVGLDDKRVAELQKVHASFRGQREALRATLQSTRWAVVALVKAESTDNAAYERALTDVKRTREQLFTLRKSEREAVSRLLSPREQARLFVAMQDLRKHRRHGPQNVDDGPSGGAEEDEGDED
jgi:Spy/CpxP family protein refolding chaperone